MGAFLMGWGEPVLSENHTGIAPVIGIVGIGMIARALRKWKIGAGTTKPMMRTRFVREC
jgi:hypothetical protein